MEIKKFEYTYRTGRKNGSITFEVIPDIEKAIPETLFKLYELNKFSVDALLNGYIYGSHPSQLNDYFDCNAQMFEFNEEAIRHFLSMGGSLEDIDYMIRNEPGKAQNISRNTFNEILYKKLGIISLTEDPFNLLMWSYYTNHKGFQVQFDLSKLYFKKHGPFPINYREELENIKISRDDTEVGVLMQTNLKHKGWAHEKEWRILGEKENMESPNLSEEENKGSQDRKFKYNSLSAIQSVQLGIRFFHDDKVDVPNDNSLIINVNSENEYKRKLLEFLTKNEIITGITLPFKLNKIVFRYGCFEKIGEFEFRFAVFEDPNKLPMTLHEAIQKLLQSQEHAMTAREIADTLNKNGWYKKKDGSLIKVNQIHRRINEYSDLFVVNKTVSPQRINLI